MPAYCDGYLPSRYNPRLILKDQPRVYPKGYFACQNNGSQIIAGQYNPRLILPKAPAVKDQPRVYPKGYAPAYCDGYLPSRYFSFKKSANQIT
jgi:hypothetical protein